MTERSRLLRLLVLLRSHAQDAPLVSEDALELAGFAVGDRPPAPHPRIEFRRVLAFIQEREDRRRERRAARRPRLLPAPPEKAPGLWDES